MQQAKEFGLTLSEWIRRCCSHHATPGQNGSSDNSKPVGKPISFYLGPRNVRKVIVSDNDLVSMLKYHRPGLPRDMRVHACQKDIIDAHFIISSSRFSVVPDGCSIPELPRW